MSPWARSPGFVADWTTKTGAAVNYLPKNFLLDAVITQPIKRIVGSNVFPLVASVVGDGMVGFALGNTCSLAVAYPFSVVCTRGVFGLALPMEPSEVFAGIGVALAGIMTYRVSECPPPTGAAVRCTHHSNSTPVVPLPFRLACSNSADSADGISIIYTWTFKHTRTHKDCAGSFASGVHRSSGQGSRQVTTPPSAHPLCV